MIMKKIIFSIFTLALATMVGCQKSEAPEISKGKQVTVTATIAGAGDSRVALTPSTDGEDNPIVKVAWKDSGESFRVCGASDDMNSTTAYQTFTQISGNKFSGELPETNDYNFYYATYPASDLITGSTDPILPVRYDKSIFTSQTGKLSEDKTVMFVWAIIDGSINFNFDHLTTLLKPSFKIGDELITADKINTITFKDMQTMGGDADFNIDCTSHAAGDGIYVYIPNHYDCQYGNPTYNPEDYKKSIDIIVKTDDAKTYEGAINIPSGVILNAGKLYTATVSLTPVVSTNVITYTTTDNQQLTLNDSDWGAGDACIYTSHTFENGIGEITLKNGVNAIPNQGFYGKDTLKSVNLPSQITTISYLSFAACTSLSSINLNNITVIVTQAFSNCSALSEITMPNNNYTIGNQSFVNCAITEIDLSNASSIDDYAFQGCNNLTTVIINNSTPPSFGSYNPFTYCDSLESIYVPDDKVVDYKAIGALLNVKDKIKGISQMP